MYGDIDKAKMTVTMTVQEYEYYNDAVIGRDYYVKMLQNANHGGSAVMTDELRTEIEEIYL